MYLCAKALQGSTYERRLAIGGTKASAWAATGVVMPCFICICIALLAFFLAAPDDRFGEEF